MKGSSTCQVAIIGAGPYGLSATAYLRSSGVECLLLGPPMESWAERFPPQLKLQTPGSIADPAGALTLETFECGHGGCLPWTAQRFAAYGRWFARRVAPDAIACRVERVEPPGRPGGDFRLRLEDSSTLRAKRVVVAAGPLPFARRLPVLAGIPPEWATHSSDHADFSRFAGKQVVVTGSGQSALETAAFLKEAGAGVELIARNLCLEWLDHGLMAPGLGVHPAVYGWLPSRLRTGLGRRLKRPAGHPVLRQRLSGIRLTRECWVRRAELACGRVRLRLSDGGERLADHVIYASGFEVDIRRYRFLAPQIIEQIVPRGGGGPQLFRGLESTVPGLHFTGMAASPNLGPALFFLSGTAFASQALAAHVSGKRVTESRIMPG